MNSITMICPTYRNPRYLDLFLKSATENRDTDDVKILVVVDGYPQESREVLSKYTGIDVIEFPQNMGMQTALNIGVMQADTPFVFIVNDDNVLPKNWASRLMRILSMESTGYFLNCGEKFILTVNQVEPTGPGMFDFEVNDLGTTVHNFKYDEWLKYEKSLTFNTNWESTGFIFPFLMEKQHYLAVGGIDTWFRSPNCCDWDFALRLELLGFKGFRTKEMHLYHFGSVVTKHGPEADKFNEKHAIAAAQYKFKWGIDMYNHPGTNSKIPLSREFRGFKL